MGRTSSMWTGRHLALGAACLVLCCYVSAAAADGFVAESFFVRDSSGKLAAKVSWTVKETKQAPPAGTSGEYPIHLVVNNKSKWTVGIVNVDSDGEDIKCWKDVRIPAGQPTAFNADRSIEADEDCVMVTESGVPTDLDVSFTLLLPNGQPHVTGASKLTLSGIGSKALWVEMRVDNIAVGAKQEKLTPVQAKPRAALPPADMETEVPPSVAAVPVEAVSEAALDLGDSFSAAYTAGQKIDSVTLKFDGSVHDAWQVQWEGPVDSDTVKRGAAATLPGGTGEKNTPVWNYLASQFKKNAALPRTTLVIGSGADVYTLYLTPGSDKNPNAIAIGTCRHWMYIMPFQDEAAGEKPFYIRFDTSNSSPAATKYTLDRDDEVVCMCCAEASDEELDLELGEAVRPTANRRAVAPEEVMAYFADQ